MDNINSGKLITALLGLLCLAVAACGPAATPTPTPDVPRFADGEATAVVKEWISDKTAIPNPHPSCRFVEEILKSPEMIWSERYLGNGVWSVTLAAGEGVISALEGLNYEQLAESNPVGVSMVAALSEGGEWQVYEYSGKVSSMRTSYADIFCR